MSSLRCGTQSSPLVNSRTAEHSEPLHSVAQHMRYVLAVACNLSIQWKAMVLPPGVNPSLLPHLHFASAWEPSNWGWEGVGAWVALVES